MGVLTLLAHASAARAQDAGGTACAPGPGEVDDALEAHMRLRDAAVQARADAADVYRDVVARERAVLRGEVVVTAVEQRDIEARHALAARQLEDARLALEAWGACRNELLRLRRFYPRSVHHLRASLGFDGALFIVPNEAHDPTVDDSASVMYRSPSMALQLGWERFYTRRFGVHVNGTLAAGQGRFRACSAVWLPDCYGSPAAGGALTVAMDAGIRVWVAPILVLGLSAELRVARLPLTERVQNGRRYSVSDQVIPAAVLRFTPELLLSRDGRWWASPSFGYGRTLTQAGDVVLVAVRVGYVL